MITVQNVYAGYGTGDILQDVSFTLSQGENLSIIGPNGCGKTTLLRAIAGTLPFRGNILLDNQPISHIKKHILAKKMAMLSQMTQLYFNYTIFDTIMMGRYVHNQGGWLSRPSKIDHEVVLQVLETVGLTDLKNREIDTLSGGQLQRVFLAKILAQDPDIILLDEPTNHLDLSYQVELITFLQEWSKQPHKSVIGVLHDINLATMLSNKLMLMDNGRIVIIDENKKVLSDTALNKAYKMDISAFMVKSLKKWEDISVSGKE